jgi:hypothetical protein
MILKLFMRTTDDVPGVLETCSMIKSVQPSMHRDKVRAILEF